MAETEVKKRLTNKQAVDPIRRLFEDLNQPSEPRLKQALKARGIPFTNEQVSRIVKGSASRQIFAPRQRYVGKVTSTAPNLRWAAGMVFMTSTPSKNGQNFVLVVQDIFSRKIYTTPRQSRKTLNNSMRLRGACVHYGYSKPIGA